MYSLIFFKAKNEDKLNKVVLLLFRSKTVLAIFKKIKKIFEFIFLNFEFYSWRLFFDVKGRFLQICKKKNTFLRSLRFLKM